MCVFDACFCVLCGLGRAEQMITLRRGDEMVIDTRKSSAAKPPASNILVGETYAQQQQRLEKEESERERAEQKKKKANDRAPGISQGAVAATGGGRGIAPVQRQVIKQRVVRTVIHPIFGELEESSEVRVKPFSVNWLKPETEHKHTHTHTHTHPQTHTNTHTHTHTHKHTHKHTHTNTHTHTHTHTQTHTSKLRGEVVSF